MVRGFNRFLRVLSLRPLRAAAFVAIAGLSVASTADANTLGDTFTVGDGTGTAGAQLNGVAAEIGGTWSAGAGYEFTPAGTIFSDPTNVSGGNGNRMGLLPYFYTPSASHTLSALVRPPDTSDPGANDWVAVGFAASNPFGDAGFFTPGVGVLWLALRENGGWFAIEGSGTIIAQGGSQPGFNVAGFNPLTLTYDSGTNKASGTVNGVTVFSNYTVGSTPTVTQAGFHFHRPDFAEIDNFSVVPEPATLSLLVLTAGLSLLRRR